MIFVKLAWHTLLELFSFSSCKCQITIELLMFTISVTSWFVLDGLISIMVMKWWPQMPERRLPLSSSYKFFFFFTIFWGQMFCCMFIDGPLCKCLGCFTSSRNSFTFCFELMLFSQSLRLGRIWHKVNFF